MMILDVLRHQWRRKWRSATWDRSLIATVLLVLAAAYVGVLFVGLAWFYPEVVAEVATDRDPLRLLNAHLLYGAVGLIVLRFFLQRSAGSDMRPYLNLPLRRAQVVRIMQALSSLSLLNLLPLVVLGAGSVGMAGATHWALRTRLYDVLGGGSAGAGPAGAPLTLLRGQWGTHPAVSFALLDAKLTLRNRRPRQMLGVSLLVWVLFGVILVEGDISPFNQVLFGFILSGHLAFGYFQYGHAWHGMHFDGVLARALSPAALVRGQYLTFAGLAAAPVAVMVPFVAWMRPEFLRPIGAFSLFNLGVSAPFLIGVGVWFREALHLNESAVFNYQGTSSLHVLSFVLLLGLPVGLTIGLGKPTALLVGTGLGVLGIATAPFWIHGLGQLLYGQRHAMAAGFRDTE